MKEAFAHALTVLSQERPLSKISVKDIVEQCGVSRGVFYYHFRDKYELIQWVFYEDMFQNVDTFNDSEKLLEGFVDMCHQFRRNRQFYLAPLQYDGQNSLLDIIYHLYYELCKANLKVHYQDLRVKITENELETLSKLFAHALAGIIDEWAKTECPTII